MLNRFGGRNIRRDRDLLWIHQKGIGDPTNFRRHGGGKEQRLAERRHQADDALDIGNKSHIHHSIRFVDHQDLDVGEQDAATPEMIQ